MITLRRSRERGHAQHGWLDSRHTFSFADYYDPAHMGLRALRVLNEDRVAPGRGFPAHAHRDMEILSYVLDGALEHRDSLGNGSVIRPGELQRMSAGWGVTHGEYNGSAQDPVHFLQIWLLPSERGLAPSYEQKSFACEETPGRLRLVASRDGAEGSVTIHAAAALHVGRFEAGHEDRLVLEAGHAAWVQVARGRVNLLGHELVAGDGAALLDEPALSLRCLEAAEVLVFDLS